MPGHLPSLNEDALARLRELVRVMHGRDGRSVPMQELVALARDLALEGGVTIDFDASRLLGEPMVVLRVPASPPPERCLAMLSRREREIIALIAEGLSNKQIARRLFISLATVKDHVHRMLTKTGLSNRAALAAAFRQNNPAGSPSTTS